MRYVVIIQARMGSSRLPGKVLLPLGNSTVLSYVVDRCKNIEGVCDVVVATTISKSDDVISEWCHQNNINCTRGSEEDVLDRYIKAAEEFHADYVIRVTSDCPFVDYQLASQAVKNMEERPADVLQIIGDLPRGLAVEIISFSSLKKIKKAAYASRHTEHVTYYAYEHQQDFTWVNLKVAAFLNQPEYRITLDTQEDYILCKEIANRFIGDKYVSSRDILKFLSKNPEVAFINAHIQQKPVE